MSPFERAAPYREMSGNKDKKSCTNKETSYTKGTQEKLFSVVEEECVRVSRPNSRVMHKLKKKHETFLRDSHQISGWGQHSGSVIAVCIRGPCFYRLRNASETFPGPMIPLIKYESNIIQRVSGKYVLIPSLDGLVLRKGRDLGYFSCSRKNNIRYPLPD